VARGLRARPLAAQSGWLTIRKLTYWVCGTNSSTLERKRPLAALAAEELLLARVGRLHALQPHHPVDAQHRHLGGAPFESICTDHVEIKLNSLVTERQQLNGPLQSHHPVDAEHRHLGGTPFECISTLVL